MGGDAQLILEISVPGSDGAKALDSNPFQLLTGILPGPYQVGCVCPRKDIQITVELNKQDAF